MPNIKKKRKIRGGKERYWNEGGREEGRKKLRKHKNTKEEKKENQINSQRAKGTSNSSMKT